MEIPSPLLVLATSGPRGEIGVLRAGEGLQTVELGGGAARGRGLLPGVASLLLPRDLGGIVVDRGPGSFTGVRVGVTAAKSLAFALGVPVWGVNSLQAIATTGDPEQPVLALRDAGRGGVYAGLFGPAPARAALREPWRAPLTTVLEEVGDVPTRREDAGAAAVLAAFLAGGRGEPTPPHTLAPLYLQASAPERRLAGGG